MTDSCAITDSRTVKQAVRLKFGQSQLMCYLGSFDIDRGQEGVFTVAGAIVWIPLVIGKPAKKTGITFKAI